MTVNAISPSPMLKAYINNRKPLLKEENLPPSNVDTPESDNQKQNNSKRILFGALGAAAVCAAAIGAIKYRQNLFDNLTAESKTLKQAGNALKDEAKEAFDFAKKQIDEAFELYLKSDCDSVFAAFSAGTTHARWRKSPFTGEYECLYDYRNRPRRQDTDLHYPLFIESGAIYIVKTEVMKEVKDFIGYKPEIYLQKNPVDIDTIADFEKAEKLILERRLNSK